MEDGSANASIDYPWYGTVGDDTLEQGDFLFGLPVYIPEYPEGLSLEPLDTVDEEQDLPTVITDIGTFDVIIVTQSCDLVVEQDAPLAVIVCPVFPIEVARDYYKSLRDKGGLNNVRKGREPGLHMLNECNVAGFERPVQIVFFHQVFTLPAEYIRSFVAHSAANSAPRLRLLPPYREHLAQAFARFIMRIGLPQDIPQFK